MPNNAITKAALKVFGEDGGFGSMMEAAQQATSKDNAIHMKMFGGKDVDIIPSQKGSQPILKVSDSKGLITMLHMNQEEYRNFRSLDDYHRKMFVEDFLEKHSEDAYRKLKGSEIKDLNDRVRTHTPYTSDGVAIKYKEDMDRDRFLDINRTLDPLNPRIKNPNLRGNAMICKIDGISQVITIHNQRALEAYKNGDVSLNQLANAVLKSYDQQMANLQARVELGLDEQRNQGQSQSVGMRR